MSKSVLDCIPTLQLPNRKSYPFDIAANKIVQTLREYNWKVPGIEVEFTTYGTGFDKNSFVSKIVGYRIRSGIRTDSFILEFSYPKSGSNGIKEIIFREERIEVYDDNSGPVYWLYVGPGSLHYPPDPDELQTEINHPRFWEYTKNDGFFAKMPDETTARSEFMHKLTLSHARLKAEPRIALLYENRHRCAALTKGARITNNDDLERNYRALPSEPQSFDLGKLYNHFSKRLEKILAEIKQHPVEEEFNPLAHFKLEAKIPIETVKHPLRNIYTIVIPRNFERILNAKIDGTSNIELCDFYALGACQGGHLLVPTEEALKKPSHKYGEGVIDIPFYTGSAGLSGLWGLVEIRLKYANDCFVADGAVYMRAREEKFRKIAPRKRLNDAEIEELEEIRRKNLVPLVDYNGNYQKPYLIIDRELDFDEVEPIGEYSTSK